MDSTAKPVKDASDDDGACVAGIGGVVVVAVKKSYLHQNRIMSDRVIVREEYFNSGEEDSVLLRGSRWRR